MLSVLIAPLRVTLATVFVFAALGKLIGLPWSAEESWNPFPGVRAIWTRVIYPLIPVFELILGVAVLLAPAPQVSAAVILFLLPATAYGAISVRRIGSCGCFGERREGPLRRLLARNGAIALSALALLAIGSASGPTARTAWVPWVPILSAPLFGLFALLGILRGGGRRGDARPVRSRAAAPAPATP